jgi:hypothetical protein
MASAWIDEIAVRDVSLHGTQLASALAYAEGQRWLADCPTRKDWIYLTRTGEIVAKGSFLNAGHPGASSQHKPTFQQDRSMKAGQRLGNSPSLPLATHCCAERLAVAGIGVLAAEKRVGG